MSRMLKSNQWLNCDFFDLLHYDFQLHLVNSKITATIDSWVPVVQWLVHCNSIPLLKVRVRVRFLRMLWPFMSLSCVVKIFCFYFVWWRSPLIRCGFISGLLCQSHKSGCMSNKFNKLIHNKSPDDIKSCSVISLCNHNKVLAKSHQMNSSAYHLGALKWLSFDEFIMKLEGDTQSHTQSSDNHLITKITK